MDLKLNCDFFFGNKVEGTIKQFNPLLLKGFKSYISSHKIKLFPLYYKKKLLWIVVLLHTNIKNIFSKKYDTYLITGQTNMLINWLILVYAKITNKKVYAWGHGLIRKISNPLMRGYLSLFYKSLEGLFIYSEHNSQFIVDLGVDENKIYPIHNSLDTKVQSEIYNSLKPSSIFCDHFGNANPVVIYIGRLQKRKKLDQLVDAIHMLSEEGKIYNLIIVGGVEDDNEIVRYAKNKHIDKQIWFYGPCYEEKSIAELIYNASVCVCPAAVGLTCIHSLSYGTPVISNDNFDKQMPECYAIRRDVTGSFFIEDNINDLSCHIERWCKINTDERENLRQTARHDILNYWSVDYQVDLLNKVL